MSVNPFFDPRTLGEMVFGDNGRLDREYVPISENNDDLSDCRNEIVDTHEKFSVNLNVPDVKPEELKINLEGRKLSIKAEHQEIENDNISTTQTYSKSIVLPEDVDVTHLSSNLSEDGKLLIEVPKVEAKKTNFFGFLSKFRCMPESQ
ncbi:SHSP domain-containing protein [Caenorhabditis elegans]|uniref:SHSP domain-containing protein n=1 Tax=Caenorhabditis elegans TaxID=6239 RepID=Q19227_CAEEL|nr:SHSP domain-containing protein [Caenorhabditis elegans]CAB01146.1 SHSP domain-containing protein [Caenorhabditis elegans]|eukprot:NP_506585.1 Uncharacterized protein CELE_F08H9.3 [Caenorhabditis elegans]